MSLGTVAFVLVVALWALLLFAGLGFWLLARRYRPALAQASALAGMFAAPADPPVEP